MAANGTLSQSGSNGDTITLNLTWTALVISIGAFVLSTVQAILAYLQFDNSEVGRRRCSEEVMGELWAARTTKEFKWRDWRYQVFYEAPLFYTAPSGVTVGPLLRNKPKVSSSYRFWRVRHVKDPEDERLVQESAVAMEVIEVHKRFLPIYKITGSGNSCKQTMTSTSNIEGAAANSYMIQDEGCSWLLLLEALQTQESQSRKWDNAVGRGLNHPLCCFIQRFRRCWDHMPINITKPYATINICHLVEIMSMLGLVWKEFDVKKSSLTAEGNGYMLKGEYVAGLGGSSILMRFACLSKSNHEENRIIPCCELKRLCFGEVPSLFDFAKERLQVSPGRLEQCLKRLLPQLDGGYRAYFMDTARIPRPLMFPITFELIAMFAKPVHILGSRFRRLPNPCADGWTTVLDMAECLDELGSNLRDSPTLGSNILKPAIQGLFESGRLESLVLTNGENLTQQLRAYSDAATRLANERAEKFYYPVDSREDMKELATRDYNARFLDMLDNLHTAVELIDEMLQPMVETPRFREVVTLHFQAVIDQRHDLNSEMETATSENPREKILMNFYFHKVHPAATSGSAEMSDIWLGLMFRMWSWLFLHNFNPEDRMIERAEFMNNRLPVYIG